MRNSVLGGLVVGVFSTLLIFGRAVHGQSQDPTGLSARELAMQVSRRKVRSPQSESSIALAATISLNDLGVPSKALREFEKGRKLLLEAHRSAASIVFFRKAIDLAPLYSEAYFLLGVAYIDVDQNSDAETSLVKATSINDKNGPAYLALGYCLIKQKKYGESERPLLRGLDSYPDSSLGQYDLARTYYALNRFQEAEEHVRKAISLTPDIATMHALLANVLLLADRRGALHEFEETLRLEPNGPSSAHIEDIVRRLKISSLSPSIADRSGQE